MIFLGIVVRELDWLYKWMNCCNIVPGGVGLVAKGIEI